MKKLDPSKYFQAYLYMGYAWVVIVLIMLFLTSCYVYEGTYHSNQTNVHSCELMDRGEACLSDHSCCKDNTYEVSYWKINYVPTIELYYHNELPYWGYYSGYYYYYGYRHIYPWWYYYNYRPAYYYNVTTHVHCHVGNSGYVYRPRGNWRHNNKKHLNYKHNNIKNTGINVKDRVNTPTKWRNVNKVNIKTNTINRGNTKHLNTKSNINRTNIKTNTKINNKSNIKINTNKNNKSNINKNRGNTNKINIKRNNIKTNTNKRSNINRKPR
jgi:hypothetical protein